MVRGLKKELDIFLMFMQCQMFPWKRTNLKTKKEGYTLIQGALREFGFLYEYVFPKECLQEVLTMLNAKDGDTNNLGEFRSWIIRKVLGYHGKKVKIKPIPDYEPIKPAVINSPIQKGVVVATHRHIPMHGVAVYLIGIKEDVEKDYDFGAGQLWHQEGL